MRRHFQSRVRARSAVLVGALVLATALAVSAPTAAFASSSDPKPSRTALTDSHLQSPYVKKVRATMTQVCNIADPQRVRQGDNLAQLCQAPDAVKPLNVVTGNCGESWLFIFDLGSGRAGFSVGALSTLGNIVFGSATVTWINVNNLNFNTVNRLVTGNATPRMWADFFDQPTGAGTVVADMSGDVFVGNLTICSIDFPSDVEGIT